MGSHRVGHDWSDLAAAAAAAALAQLTRREGAQWIVHLLPYWQAWGYGSVVENRLSMHEILVQSPVPPSSYFGFPWWLRQYRIHLQCGRPGFNPWFGKIPWRREWQVTPVSLPGEFHGQRSLAGYSPWGCKESDMTERLQLSLFTLLADQHSLWNGGLT